ncbi:MAG: DUF1846 family protein [Victivallales bacterium]|nr:DUF1846 family protein [Victivallales bacterium]
MPLPFDNEKYLTAQTEQILKRVNAGQGRLFLEFGGKLIGDFHAARILPGFDPDVKLHLLEKLAAQADILICINADDIEHQRVRADFGITYDNASLKLIDDLRAHGIDVTAVIVNRYHGQPSVKAYQDRLARHGIKVYLWGDIAGYPNNIEHVVSPEGFGAQEYVPVTKPLVVVTAPGPNSGKMNVCLTEMYHEAKLHGAARYAKFETFPVWNLPLSHPVNIAYESATADLMDNNAMDNFHFDAYGIAAVNYNRDLQAFPLLRTLITKITGSTEGYQSPTDMGVNCVAQGIVDDAKVREAANQEIIRRYFQYNADFHLGHATEQTVQRAEDLIHKAGLETTDRKVVAAAREAARRCEEEHGGDNGVCCGAAIQLPDGSIVTGKNSSLMHSTAAMILNAAKKLAGIPDDRHLLPEDIMNSVAVFKNDLRNNQRVSLNLSEALIVLIVSAARDSAAKWALDALPRLKRCDVHLSHLPGSGDAAGLRRLGISFTYDPLQPTKKLFP